MSAWRAFKSRNMNLLERTERLMRAKAIKKPLWYDAMKAYPPDPVIPPYAPPPKNIEFPEDRLLQKYFRLNPAEKGKTVFNLFDQTKKPPAVLFVSRQMELMNSEGLSEKAAYEKTKQEMFGGGAQIGPSGRSGAESGDSVSLREKFDEWMQAEDAFWRKQAAVKNSKKSK